MTLRVNPADPSEIVVILEVGEDEEVVITLENESGDHITVEVEDDMLATVRLTSIGVWAHCRLVAPKGSSLLRYRGL